MILSELIYWSVSSYCRTMGESDNASDTWSAMTLTVLNMEIVGLCRESLLCGVSLCGRLSWQSILHRKGETFEQATFSALQIDFSFRVFVCAAAYTTASFTLYLSLSVSYMYASFSCAFCLFFLSVVNFSVVSFLLILSFQIYLWFLPLHSSLFAFNALFL